MYLNTKYIYIGFTAFITLLYCSCSSSKKVSYDDEGSLSVVATAVREHEVKTPEPTPEQRVPLRTLDWTKVNVSALFNDVQALQLSSAQLNGIEPMDNTRPLQARINQGRLVPVSSTNHYVIADLTHSYPYLVPKAAQIIDEIGQRVQQITGTQSRIIITSLLRTKATQRKLGTRNANAAQFSCHFFGTTFDIAYNDFELSGGATSNEVYIALCQAVYEMKMQQRLWVKYEHGQHCLHCTIR